MQQGQTFLEGGGVFTDKTGLKTRPSILCVTHQMVNFKWYLMVLGQSMTILAGTWSV